MAVKYVFVMGGVVSGLGKGITAASLGRLLKARGIRVTMQKLDPYLNVDPGTMNPVQHGEVFVTEDGTETDLDLGHYERFIDENLGLNANVTTGKVYSSVLRKEREGAFGGGTVQVIPHITDEIKSRFYGYQGSSPKELTVSIIEVGGTVGDIESQPFLEAIRQFTQERGPKETMLILVSLVPFLRCSGELKSKPTQMAVRTMQQMGLMPDVIVCRSEVPLSRGVREKIAHFCNVSDSHVVENLDLGCLYEAPLALEQENLAHATCECLGLSDVEPDLRDWKQMVEDYLNPRATVKIALVGKYTSLHDAYLSVAEALKAGGIACRAQVEIDYVDSEKLTEENVAVRLGDCDGILVPGGFGERGIEGMLCAIRYAREEKKPYLGICLGMQLACVEVARNVCGMADADSVEFNEQTTHPIIHLMPDQEGVTDLGGTLRLGSYPCVLEKDSMIRRLYDSEEITERHRHRYEFNNAFRQPLSEAGLKQVGVSPDGRIVEMVELEGHPYFAATQSHPEFKSRPNRPHPLFVGLVRAAAPPADCEV